MIIRIGSHDVELAPHQHDASLLVGSIGPICLNAYRRMDMWSATASLLADEDGEVIGRGDSDSVGMSCAIAIVGAVASIDSRAERARREYEQLDVHALRVADRMRETAAIAERARALLAPKLPEAT